MTYKHLTLGIALLMVFNSCKKTSQTDPLTATSYKIKTYSEDITQLGNHTINNFNISYNTNGLISLKQSLNDPNTKIIYNYLTDNTFSEDSYNNNNILVSHSVFYLKNNLVDSFTEMDNGVLTTYKLLYNNLNQLVTETDYIFNNPVGPQIYSTNFFYDSFGNETKEISSDGVERDKSYYLNEINKIDFLYPYVKPSVNLLETVRTNLNGSTAAFTHFYNFDNLHRVILDSIYFSQSEIIKYSYSYY